MTIYAIVDTSVTAHATRPTDLPAGAIAISDIDALDRPDLPSARLVALWNTLPGVTPIAKFKDRRTAIHRLWAAFGQLPLTAAADGASPAGKARRPRATDTPASAASGAATGKTAQVIALLRRPEGATLEALVEATGWQRHSLRGLIAGALKKKLGLAIVAERTDGGRRYRIAP